MESAYVCLYSHDTKKKERERRMLMGMAGHIQRLPATHKVLDNVECCCYDFVISTLSIY